MSSRRGLRRVNFRKEFPARRKDFRYRQNETERIWDHEPTLESQPTNSYIDIGSDLNNLSITGPLTEFFLRQVPMGSSLKADYFILDFDIEHNYAFDYHFVCGVPHADSSAEWRFSYRTDGSPNLRHLNNNQLSEIYTGKFSWWEQEWLGRNNYDNLHKAPLATHNKALVSYYRKGFVGGPIRTNTGQSIPRKSHFRFFVRMNQRLFVNQNPLQVNFLIDQESQQPRHVWLLHLMPRLIAGVVPDPGASQGYYCRMVNIKSRFHWFATEGRGPSDIRTVPAINSLPMGGGTAGEGQEGSTGDLFPSAVWGSGDVRMVSAALKREEAPEDIKERQVNDQCRKDLEKVYYQRLCIQGKPLLDKHFLLPMFMDFVTDVSEGKAEEVEDVPMGGVGSSKRPASQVITGHFKISKKASYRDIAAMGLTPS